MTNCLARGSGEARRKAAKGRGPSFEVFVFTVGPHDGVDKLLDLLH